MASVFYLPRQLVTDAAGAPVPSGKIRFYDAGTTTPRTVYSNAALSTPITQPIDADASGALPKIYLPTGSYKITVYNASSTELYTEDNLDPLVSTTAGDLAVADGGTGSSTAAGARTNLGAASQADVTSIASDLAAVEALITGIGGSFGDLAALDTLTRTQLATGFGLVQIKYTEVAASTAVATLAGTIPFDNTIPQISEGTEALTGSYTPASSTSVLEIEVSVQIGSSGDVQIATALFQNTDLDAIAARWNNTQGANDVISTSFVHRMNSPGTSPITFSVRCGQTSGSCYLNGIAANRIGGGVVRSYLRVREFETY